jgi:hypothetical protein
VPTASVQINIQHVSGTDFTAHVFTRDLTVSAGEMLLLGCRREQQKCHWIDRERRVMVLEGTMKVFRRLEKATKDEIQWMLWHSDGCCHLGR